MKQRKVLYMLEQREISKYGFTWGVPRPKSGAIGAQILKFSKECLGTLLRIFLQYP